RYLRLARLSDADQGRLSVPGFDSGSPHRARPRAVPRPGAAQPRVARAGHSGVVELLSEVAHDGAGTLSRARSFHPAYEAAEHATPPARRPPHHPFGTGILRLAIGSRSTSHATLAPGSRQIAGTVPALGCAGTTGAGGAVRERAGGSGPRGK